MSTEDPRWGPPPQGYPPQGGQYPPAEGYYGQPQQGQQSQYGGQYGQPQQGQYGQQQYGQYGQYGQQGGQYAPLHQQGQYGQYGQQQAQTPYNPQYAQPYAQPAAQRAPAATIKNPYATRSLVYGILSMVTLIIILFTPIGIFGLWSIYAVYYGIRGIIYSTKLPGNKGIASAVIGLLLSVLSLVGILVVLALSAMS